MKATIDEPPGWLQEWSRQIGAPLKDGLRELPGWIAFAREKGTDQKQSSNRSYTP